MDTIIYSSTVTVNFLMHDKVTSTHRVGKAFIKRALILHVHISSLCNASREKTNAYY